ncbi:MAG: hypothetical protein HY368_03020 [Candidatus Aenigmarchaeota archaeon]|nr:hypothetical protein [Candidatus Aenigmarchaeota archaeon]
MPATKKDNLTIAADAADIGQKYGIPENEFKIYFDVNGEAWEGLKVEKINMSGTILGYSGSCSIPLKHGKYDVAVYTTQGELVRERREGIMFDGDKILRFTLKPR